MYNILFILLQINAEGKCTITLRCTILVWLIKSFSCANQYSLKKHLRKCSQYKYT